jgi:glycosyltransferase involved in cell wall biosynthesis
MRVVVALSQPPLPEGGAPGRCAVALLRGLQSHGVGVHAVAADRRPNAQAKLAVPSDLPVDVVRSPETLSRADLYRAKVARPRGELARGAFDTAYRAAATDADVLHLEETDTGWSAYGTAAPRVLRVHYLAQLDQRMAGLWGKDPLRRAEELYAEMRLARAHRWLIASSTEVADALQRMSPQSEVIVAPLSLDPRYYEPAPLNGPPIAGIIGTAMWPPTRSAILRLVNRVWPVVRRSSPAARLRIAGRGVDELRSIGSGRGIQVVGPVESASAFLRELSVLIYPVSLGSGMKVKVMEALACGVPVVTTPRGAEGIGANAGLLVETRDSQLAVAVHELLSDPVARAQRGAAGRAHFLRTLAPRPAAEPLVQVYADAYAG